MSSETYLFNSNSLRNICAKMVTMRKDLKVWLGKRIREAREAAGYSSQLRFSVDLGLPQSNVSRWEHGEQSPGQDNLEKIAKLTRKPMEFFSPVGEGTSRNDLIVEILEMLPFAPEDALTSISRLLLKYRSSKAESSRKA